MLPRTRASNADSRCKRYQRNQCAQEHIPPRGKPAFDGVHVFTLLSLGTEYLIRLEVWQNMRELPLCGRERDKTAIHDRIMSIGDRAMIDKLQSWPLQSDQKPELHPSGDEKEAAVCQNGFGYHSKYSLIC